MMPAHKVIQLKNGRKIYLRSIKRSDIEEIWNIFGKCQNEGFFFPKYIRFQSEYEKLNWYHNFKLYNNLSMIAEEINEKNKNQESIADRKILGLCIIENVEWDAATHVGNIYSIIRKENRNMGLGTELLRFSFKEAKKRGKAKISASITSENQSAIKFYQKLGFKKIGYRKKHFKINNNKYLDEILLDYWIKK